MQAGVAVSLSDSSMTSSSQQLPVLDIPRPFEALSDVSNDSSHNGRDCDSQETTVSERLGQPPSLSTGSSMLTAPRISSPSAGPTGLEGPRDKSPASVINSKSRKKSKKHKDKEKTKDRERTKEREQEKKGRKSREDRVPEPNKACEMSPRNLKSNSIPHKSTGESDAHLFPGVDRIESHKTYLSNKISVAALASNGVHLFSYCMNFKDIYPPSMLVLPKNVTLQGGFLV